MKTQRIFNENTFITFINVLKKKIVFSRNNNENEND